MTRGGGEGVGVGDRGEGSRGEGSGGGVKRAGGGGSRGGKRGEGSTGEGNRGGGAGDERACASCASRGAGTCHENSSRLCMSSGVNAGPDFLLMHWTTPITWPRWFLIGRHRIDFVR